MLKRWLLVAVLSVALSTMYLVGCSNEDDPDGPGDTNDTTAANQAVQQGNEILADVLFEMINTEPEEISDVDITEAYGYYQDAIVADSDNPGGHFGMGILEVFTLTQDAETQQFFDNMKEYWSGDSWFLEEGGNPAPFANTGAYGRSGVSYIIAGPLVMMKGMSGISEEYGHSTGDMQQFARDKLIPLITSAVNHLLVVATYQDFVFMVTPEMQGDLYEDAVELDLTEVHATIAALSSMEALLQQFVAYNLDLGDYTSADMLNAFTQDSDFMSLEADGSSRMQSALAAWARAATHIDDGLTFLKNEVDDQANDLIRIDPYEGLTQEDIEDIEDGLEQIIDGLTGTAEIEVEIDDEMVLLDMSAYNFFGTPVENIKALLPAYTVELDLDPDGRPDWDDMVQVEEGNVAVVLTVNDPGNYYWYKQGEYYRGEEEYVSDWITGEIPELDIEYNTRVTEYEDENYVMIYVTFSGYLEAGVNEVFAYVEVMTGDVPYRYVPVFTWEADRGEDWILPDPTFGGLLPGMTDSEFKDLIDWTPDDFEKTFTMHIWDMFDWD